MILAAVLTIIGLLKFKNNTTFQIELLGILIVFYLTWATAHHWIDKSLTLEIVLEYVLIVGLTFVVLYGLLF